MVIARNIQDLCPLLATRNHRLLVALAVIWLFGTFDLFVTVAQARHPDFCELNPLAQPLIGQPLYVLAVYKYSLLGGASVIFVMLRTHRSSELGAWFLAASHFVLLGHWALYFSLL